MGTKKTKSLTAAEYKKLMEDQQRLGELIKQQGGPPNLFNVPKGGYEVSKKNKPSKRNKLQA